MKIYELANKPGRIFIETPEMELGDRADGYAPVVINFPELVEYASENGISGWHDLEEFCHLEPVTGTNGFRWVMGAETTTETEEEEAPVDEQENSTALYYERMEMKLAGIRCR